jgi:hypothetical protein
MSGLPGCRCWSRTFDRNTLSRIEKASEAIHQMVTPPTENETHGAWMAGGRRARRPAQALPHAASPPCIVMSRDVAAAPLKSRPKVL